jgi:rhamnosyltransferase
MRAKNDMPLVRETVRQVRRQTVPVRLIAFDNGSSDGTREFLKQQADVLIDVPAGEYVPGRVLNEGAKQANSEIVVFLNADCTPSDPLWLERLLEPFQDLQVGAVFGRQLPRPECEVLAAKDIEATYGDGSMQKRWRHCFSMASSAIRKSAWDTLPFNESVQYSEDIDWSLRLRQAGSTIRYAADSCVLHSHNYSQEQWSKRQYGEGKAEAVIFPWTPWQQSFLRYSLTPFIRQILSDTMYCIKEGKWRGMLTIPGYRFAQMKGRRAGFRSGLKEAA